MSETARKYGTTNPVLIEARVNHDPYDEFAWCQEWRFAICDFLLFVRDIHVPGFSPGAGGPEYDTLPYETLCETQPSDAELEYALGILDRYREWLRLAGRDY